MESSPPSAPQEDGGTILAGLGELKFSPTTGGVRQMGDLKFSTLFLGGTEGKVC